VRSILILLKHRINRRAEFDRILLINTVSIDLEIFQPIYYSLLHVELYLPLPSLVYSLTLVLALL
jgi:hypothetical protein